MIIGYELIIYDDDTYMLGEETCPAPRGSPFYDWRFLEDGRPHPATCATCGRKIDPGFISRSFRTRKRKWDAAATYDGYTLVSKRFRTVAEEHAWPGIAFDVLPGDADFFRLRVITALAFDSAARGTRFENPCPECRSFHDVIGANPILLQDPSALQPDGFYRTDLEFGSGPEHSPVLVVGLEVAGQIREARLRKIDLDPIHGT